MTWPSPQEELGWGGCFANESDDLKRKFERQFGGDEARFYKHRPQAFRWTCCGTDAGMKWGCDHHGTGSKPCSCDFCRCVRRFCSFLWCWLLWFLQGWESRYLTAFTRNGVRLDMASNFYAVLIHARSIPGSLRYQLWHDLRWVWNCELSMIWVWWRRRWEKTIIFRRNGSPLFVDKYLEFEISMCSDLITDSRTWTLPEKCTWTWIFGLLRALKFIRAGQETGYLDYSMRK